jgi:hypothetical protein
MVCKSNRLYGESSLCKLLKKPSIDTDLLMKISIAMKHDFASYLTDYFSENQIDTQNNSK